jgi:hypothetical protein
MRLFGCGEGATLTGRLSTHMTKELGSNPQKGRLEPQLNRAVLSLAPSPRPNLKILARPARFFQAISVQGGLAGSFGATFVFTR